jgi:DnaJ-class molecular chaperone
MAKARDAYQVLGVDRSATADAVKKAYRKLAREHHPDRTGGDDTRFKEINAAYEALGDPEKRKLYDEFGWEAFRPGFDPDMARRFGGGQGGQVDLDDLLGFFGGSFGAFGGDPFRGGGFGSGRARVRMRKGEDLRAKIAVSVEDAVRGTEATFGAPDGSTVKVKVPKGVRPGNVLRVGGKGGPGTGGGPAGDVLLDVEIEPHPLVRIDGNDLVMDVPISFAESLRGGTLTVPTPTGTVNVKVPARAPTGTRLRLRGRGLPGRTDDDAGDLYLVLRPTPPDGELADEVLTALSAAQRADVRAGLRFTAG